MIYTIRIVFIKTALSKLIFVHKKSKNVRILVVLKPALYIFNTIVAPEESKSCSWGSKGKRKFKEYWFDGRNVDQS